MTKTASIASSVNMEFETTAAFLAQMIETTREPAENLGTAMKTIIARFQEMKSAPQDTFDVDGETVSVNKVETALKSVGVQLRDTKGQFRDLDDVFLDLAERWDSLDIMQQRYVATTAAGSRQQSRFIAMMSNYDRVMELVGAAYDSADSADKQFEKTLDSLEAKLNRLSSAWQQFTMGIANSTFIKGAVDGLTWLLTGINNLTERLGTLGGAIAKIGVVWASLKIGKAGFNGIFSLIGKTMGVAGTQAGQQFQQNFSKSISKISLKEGAQLKAVAASLQKELGKTDFINLDTLKTSFSKIPAQLQASIMQSTPQTITALGSSMENALVQSMGSTDDEVLEWVQRIRQKFEEDLKTVGLDTAVQNAMNSAAGGVQVDSSLPGVKKTITPKKGWTKSIGLKANEVQDLTSSMRQLGQTAGVAGSALMNFSTVLVQLGLEKAASLTRVLGSAFMSLGGVITSIMSMVTLLGGPVTIAIAAISALAIGAGVLFNNYKETQKKRSVEYRLEQATEKAQQAKEAAEDAKSSYDELLNSKTSYEETQNALDELILGTAEWSDKLAEANQQVLELLQTFPALVNYIEKVNGRLEIADEGWEAVTEEQKKNSQSAQMAAYSANLEQIALEREQALKNYRQSSDYLKNKKFVGMADVWGTSAPYADIGWGADDVAEAYLKTLQDAFTQAVESAPEGASIQDMKAAALKNLRESFESQGMEAESATFQASQAVDSFFESIITDYNQYNERISELDLQADAQKFSMISTAIQDANLGETADTVQSALEKMFDPSTISVNQDKIDALADKDENELVEQYASLYGKTEDAVNEMFANAENKKESLKQGIIAKLQGDEILNAVQQQIDAISELISSDTSGITEAIFEAIGGSTPSTWTEDFLKGRVGMSAGAQQHYLEWAATQSGQSLEEWASAANKTIPEFVEAFSSGIETAWASVVKERSSLIEQGIRVYAKSGVATSQSDIYALAKMVDEVSPVIRDSLQGVFTEISSLGAETQETIIKGLAAGYDYGGEENLSNLIDWVGQIDFSNPIEEANKLASGFASLDPAISAFAASIYGFEKENIDAKSQIRYTMSTEDWTEQSGIQEQLDKVFEKGKKLTKLNIEDLANQFSAINDLLEQGAVDAETLATVLNGIHDGTIQFEELNSAILQAISSVKTLTDYEDSMDEFISNFNAGVDSGEGIDWLEDAGEKMKQFADDFEYGNTQFQNYFNSIFSEGFDEVLAKGGTDKIDSYISWLQNAVKGDGLKFWEDTVKAGIDGLKMWTDQNGQVVIDTMGHTTDEIVSMLADQKGLTEDAANMFVQNFKSHSTDFAKEVGLSDMKKSLDEAVKSWHDDYGSNLILSDDDVRVLAQRFNQTEDEVRSFLESYQAEGGNITLSVTTFYNDDGSLKQGEELIEAVKTRIQEVNGETIDPSADLGSLLGLETELDKGVLNVDTLQQKLNELNIPSDVLPSIVSALQAEIPDLELEANVEIPEIDENGKYTITIDTVPFDNLEDKAAAIQERLDQVNVDNLADSLANVDTDTIGNNLQDSLQSAGDSAASYIASVFRSMSLPTKTLWVEPKLTSSTLNITANVNTSSAGSAGIRKAGVTQYSVNRAVGSPNSGEPRATSALVSEEGPELIQTKNGAYVSGIGGPEVVSLAKGDMVYTADETAQILKGRAHIILPRFATGRWGKSDVSEAHGSSTSSSKSSSSSSSTDDVDEWKNDYDWLYNLTEDINEQLRIREKLEKRYSRILRDETKSISDLAQNIYSQIDSLEAQRKLQQEMYNKRKFEMEEALKAYSDISEYATYNWKDNTIEIDWGKIDEVTDSELGDRIDEYIDHLERIQDAMDDAEDSLDDIIDEIQDLKDEGKDEYSSFEEKVMDAYVQREQEKIDTLTDLDTDITNANSKLLSSIQSNLDKIRQERNNQKTEESLAEKERRLAYLRQDTSGANALEIKELEKELADSRQDYTDSLIDQKISELQDQNDRASEERQQQIELLQAQLDYSQKNGEYWPLVYSLIMTGVNDQSQLVKGSELEALFHNSDEWDGMSGIQKMAWLEEINQEIKAGFAWLIRNSDAAAIARQYENSFDKNTDYQAIINRAVASGDYTTAAYAEQRRNAKIDALGLDYEKTFKYQKYLSNYDKNIDYQAKINEAVKQGDYLSAAMYEQQRNAKITGEGRKEQQTHYYEMYLTSYGLDLSKYNTSTSSGSSNPSSPTTPSSPENTNSTTTTPRVGSKVSIKDSAKTYGGNSTGVSIPNWVKTESKNGYTVSAINSTKGEALIKEIYSWVKLSDLDLKQYKKGGLVDSTGLAWLDGTKTAPEMVLSARDTENLITLKDVLRDILKQGAGNSAGDSGEVTINVDIKVDKISDDYDVDRMVERVKKSINQDARYRNINALNRLSR